MKHLLFTLLFIVIIPIYGQDASYNSFGLSVYFDESFDNPQYVANIQNFLKAKQIGSVSTNRPYSNIALGYDGKNYTIAQISSKNIIYKIDNSKPSKTLQLIKDNISQFAHGYVVKELSLRNDAYKFSFRIKPVDKKRNEISLDNYPTTNGYLNFTTNNSAAVLEVTNLSDNPIYFSVIEIDSKGQINSFVPNVNCPLIGAERRIEPHKTVEFTSCFFEFAPPYETLTLKGFASPEPINFNPLIRTEENASLDYIKDFYTEMFTYEYKYNIVDNNGNMPYNTPVDVYQINTSPELKQALAELNRLNKNKTLGAISGIKGSKNNSKFSAEYIAKLKDISDLHTALGNYSEAQNYISTYHELKAKSKFEKSMSEKSTSNSAKREAIRREVRFRKMTDAEKVEYLKKENSLKTKEIDLLKSKIEDLTNQLKKLASTRGTNTQTRGARPSKKIESNNLSKFTYRALIIAEEDYDDDNIKDLKFPISDAKKLKSILIKNYAFNESNVQFLKNPTRKEIIDALQTIYKQSTNKDHLLIFYAGHGVYDQDFKRGYWLPSDAELESKSSWVSNLDLKDYITNINSKHTLLISDACFSGSIFEYNRDVEVKKSSKAINKLLEKNARNAMTSGLDKPVPDESVFIKYLLKALQDNDKSHLKASDLFNTIQEVVLNNTDNIPQYGVIRNANHEGGEFIFLKRNE